VAVWSTVTVVVCAAAVMLATTVVVTAVVVTELVVVDAPWLDSWCSVPGLRDEPDEPEEPEDEPEEPEPPDPFLDPLRARGRDARELVSVDVLLVSTAPEPAELGTISDGPNVCVVDDTTGAATVVVPHPLRQIPALPASASIASQIRTIH
jgi:hypothetical protein